MSRFFAFGTSKAATSDLGGSSMSGRGCKGLRPAAWLRLRLEILEDRTVPSTFTVTNLANAGTGSLRAAIASANAAPGADTIKFAGGLRGTITLASELSVMDDLNINGPGAQKVTVSGNDVTRVFHVSGSTTDLAIDGLTVAHGLASNGGPAGTALGGGLLNDGASVTLSKVIFASNQAVSSGAGAGGGAVANLGGLFSADHTDFLDNTASGAGTNSGNGGAVYDDQQAIVDIKHGTFSGNLATAGNANGGAIGHYNGSQLTLAHCSFAGNEAHAIPPGSPFALDATGGAIASDNLVGFFPVGPALATLTITHCSFTGNLAVAEAGGSAEAGALGVNSGATATVSHCTFDGNRARAGDGSAGMNGGTSGGGAIFTANADLTVSHSRFSGNETHGGNGGNGDGGNGGDGNRGLGGAINANFAGVASTTTISDCLFVGNRAIGGDGGAGGSGGNGGSGARGDGGAIINLVDIMTVSDCSIVGNTAGGGAGGAPGSGVGTVGGVGGLGRGGGFSNELGGNAKLTHTLIRFNQATGGTGGTGAAGGNAVGGGVYNGRPGPTDTNLELVNCLVSANRATGGAGGTGGDGGFARGGGIYNGNTNADGTPDAGPGPILRLDSTNVTDNRAIGGAAGSGGVAGVGEGGGLYNQTGAVAYVDSSSRIKGNKATTSNPDVFGVVILT